MESAATLAAIAGAVYAARVTNAAREQPSLFSECVVGGGANAFVSAFLNPMDVCKTRMQVEVMKGDRRDGAVHGSMVRSLRKVYAEGGIIGLWTPGLTATMVREMFNCSARTGLYVPVRNLFSSVDSGEAPTLGTRICAALTTGTIGSIVSNPVDVVKVRLLNAPSAYPSTFRAYPMLLREEGVQGAFRGVLPSTLRGAFIAVGELAAYDQVKHEAKLHLGLAEGTALHVLASLVTGVVATTLAAPFDLIKTRTMSAVTPVSPLEILSRTIREEGPRALLRGWVPSYMRLGPHALICLPVFEQLRAFVGVGYL
jgi:hypothetical protein